MVLDAKIMDLLQ